MLQIDLKQAQECFLDLVDRVIDGKEVAIIKANQPLIKLVAVANQKKQRYFGSAKGQIKMSDDL